MQERRNTDKILVGTPQGKRLLGRLGYRIILKRNLRNWTELAQDRVQWWDSVNMGSDHSGSIKTRNFFIS
jgi:hypothetical protein